MRLNTIIRGMVADEFIFGDITIDSPLSLTRNPVWPLEAVTKQYVDNGLLSLNASNVTLGTLSSNRFPAMVGDLTSTSGTTNFILTNTGVVAGTYSKVNVDNKGRVIGGLSLIESDIPNLNWNKITSDRPTTLSGWGIVDGLGLSGGTVTGPVSVSGTVTASNQLANKVYADTVAGGLSGSSVGDVIFKTNPPTPAGFLRCNGAWVSTTTFGDLYAVIGDTFTNPLVIGSGQPWRQQYDINTTQSENITGWTTGTSLPGVLVHSQAIVTRNRVFLLGGWTTAPVSTVYTAPINADGTLGAWTIGTSLPVGLHVSQAIVTRNRVFLLGGWITAAVSTVYTAPINADGTLGAWTIGTSLPGALAYSQAIVTRNRVYLLGGGVTAPVSTVYTAPINADGTLGAWTIGTPLPDAFSHSQAIVTRNRVYLLGEYIVPVSVSTVYTAPINADGTLGAWTIGTSLPGGLAASQAIVTRNRVFLLGGWTTATVSTVYTAPINADGTLGAWTIGTPLPGGLHYSQAIVTRNRVFLLGGWTTVAVSTVYTAPILGGLNDYSPYYDGSIEALRLTTFAIPDFSAHESQGLFYYIKF